MNINFNEMPWHDAELLKISIDREKPGENDQILLEICWPNNEKNQLIFHDCYELEAKMNFGIIAPESILRAAFITKSQKITDIKKKWSQIGVDLEHLKCFEIETNSTGSVIQIYAFSCSLTRNLQ